MDPLQRSEGSQQRPAQGTAADDVAGHAGRALQGTWTLDQGVLPITALPENLELLQIICWACWIKCCRLTGIHADLVPVADGACRWCCAHWWEDVCQQFTAMCAWLA